jgi:hypothetical protein
MAESWDFFLVRDSHPDVNTGAMSLLSRFVAFAFALSAGRAPANDDAVRPITAPPAELKAPDFYKKHISAGGYPIVASDKVNDYALREAAYLVDLMLAKRPDVKEAMIASGSRLCIMAYNEYTTDLPEFAHLGAVPMRGFKEVSGKEYWDTRARGLGGSEHDPLCSCGEENLLCFAGDPYSTENILIHEFAHNIHLRGVVRVDKTFDGRLKESYRKAMDAGLWKGKYAASNHHEYFAEGVQSWFDNNRENDHDHNHVNTRAELLEYDPGLAAMCREVFGDTELKYTKPVTRLTSHMAGYDPAKAPAFAWPERLKKANDLIRGSARKRDADANGRETRTVSGWTLHIRKELLTGDREKTEKAVILLKEMLDEIVRVVPAKAVEDMRKVPLYFSPEYQGIGACAEYHPDAGWLKDHKRDPAMAKCVEFTNVAIFDAERRRMPNFALHELAHAWHDRVLSFDELRIKKAYIKAEGGGTYNDVEHRDAEGRTRKGRSYAMTNHKEYFAETTEAFFSTNDIFPFNKEELKKHDPDMFTLLEQVWAGK